MPNIISRGSGSARGFGFLSRAAGPVINTIYTLANDATLYGISTTVGSTIASKIQTLQASTCTWNSSFLYNAAPTINATNITAWASPNTVAVVWSNGATSATRDLSTQIVNAGGRCVTLVFGSIDFSGVYSISEVSGMPAAFQLLSSTGQTNLGAATTATVQNVSFFADIANTSFTVDNYYASSTPSLANVSATVFLKIGTTPYGAYYKDGSGKGHAQIQLWPGSAYGYGAVTNNNDIFTSMVARACRAIS